MTAIRTSAAALVVALLAAAWALAGQGVGWRTDGRGAYPDANPVVSWGPDRNVLWATPLPSWSNATPVAVGGRIFVCSEPTDLICLDAADGRILWKAANNYEQVRHVHPDAELPDRPPKTQPTNGYSSFTPVSDGEHVWAAFGNGVLACYDMAGNRKWIRFTTVPPSDNRNYGACSSPALAGGKLLLHIDPLTAYDPATGEQLWRQPEAQWSWGTPIPVTVGGVDVVVDGGGSLVRLADGAILPAALPRLDYNSPLVVGDVAYMIQYKSGGAFRLSSTEDGQVAAEKLWAADVAGGRHYATPLVVGSLLFDVNLKGDLTVLDIADGRVLHKRRLDLGRGTCYPSPVLAGDTVLVSMDNGTTQVLRAEETAPLVATNHLDPFRSTPIFLGDRMYVRTLEKLYCIGR